MIEAIVDLKKHARAKAAALKRTHAEALIAANRKAESDLAALKAQHAQAIADLTAKAATEIDELRRQLAAARGAVVDLQTLRQRLHSCAYASHLLAAAVGGISRQPQPNWSPPGWKPSDRVI